MKLKKLYFPTLLIAFILSGFCAFSQANENNEDNEGKSKILEKKVFPSNNEIFALHPKAGLLWNIYSADFANFQGAIDCGEFESGNGLGYIIGFTAERILTSKFHVGLGISFTDRSGELTLDNNVPAYNNAEQRKDTIYFENSLETVLSYIEFHPEIRYTLSNDLINGPFRLVGQIRAVFPIKGTFNQAEEIKEPENYYFNYLTDRTRRREIADGGIETLASLGYGFSIGVENLLDVGGDNYLTQQVMFDYHFNNIVTDASWKTFGVRLQLGFRFGFMKAPPAPPKEAPLPEPEPFVKPEKAVEEVVKKPKLDLNIIRHDLELQTGNELVATQPIVNAVFFDRNSDRLPEKYVTQNVDIPESKRNPVDIHYYVLPRIAEIVKKNPNAKIILEGATSGKEYEPNGYDLAARRAENVEKALRSLGVPENIITKKRRIEPRHPSNQEYEEGVEENQRVDIIVNNAPLQEYVNIQKYAELRGKLYVNVDQEYIPPDEGYEIMSDISNETLEANNDKEIELDVRKRIEKDREQLAYEVQAKSDNLTDKEENSIDINSLPREQVELNLENFEAILRFNYNRSDLTPENKGLLRQLAELLPEGSSVIIYGSSDALGTERRNVQLEKERAENTRDFIRSVAGDKFEIKTASGVDKFTEETPQGRFLNRSIRIRVEE